MKNKIGFLTLVLVLATPLYAQENSAPAYSELWGEQGEKWTPEGRLPDYSFAGYERGEATIPEPPATHNITDFGASGNDDTDDTEAFQHAVSEVSSGVIEIPAGRYIISDIIELTKPNLVLRGAGVDKTILFFPKTLTDVRPDWGETTSGKPTSNYSWSGGFIWVKGNDTGETIAEPGAAIRGTTMLSVPNAKAFSPGQELMLVLTDDDEHSLTYYVYAGDPGDIKKIGHGVVLPQVFRVLAASEGHIQIDRPLRADIRPEWKPILREYKPTVTQVGIENLTFEFPDTNYEGHFTELGHNGIAMSNVAHCWIRNIHFQNAESGIFFHGRFSTIKGVSYHSTRKGDRFDNKGHHGVVLSGEDNIFTDFDFQMKFLHDLTVSSGSIGNVFSNGHGIDINFDHHRRGPYENLFTNIDVGKGSRIWSSGGEALGKNSAARNTFWNLRSATPLKPPAPYFSPRLINIIGITTDTPKETSPDGLWFEVIPPKALLPQDIHEAQQQRRLQTH